MKTRNAFEYFFAPTYNNISLLIFGMGMYCAGKGIVNYWVMGVLVTIGIMLSQIAYHRGVKHGRMDI